MATWVKCTDENGQTIYANLDNAITLFRDDVRHRGTVIAFMGSANGAIRQTKSCNRLRDKIQTNHGTRCLLLALFDTYRDAAIW